MEVRRGYFLKGLFYEDRKNADEKNRFDERAHFLVALKREIGEQKIDLVIKNEKNSNQDIIQEAYNSGVVL